MRNNISCTLGRSILQRSTLLSNRKQRSSTSLLKCLVTDCRLSGLIESYTQGEPNVDGQPDPTKSGSVLTYGPYGEIPPTMDSSRIQVHYEYTAPIAYVEHLERDIEVSHLGSNLAIEERYQLTNRAAKFPPFPSSLTNFADSKTNSLEYNMLAVTTHHPQTTQSRNSPSHSKTAPEILITPTSSEMCLPHDSVRREG